MKSMRYRRALWLLPALITLLVLGGLLILANGGSLSAFSYKSF